MTQKILITGSTGFVGARLLERCIGDKMTVSTISRSGVHSRLKKSAQHHTRGFEFADDLSVALHGQDVLIHCAARVHVMAELSTNPLADFRRINVEGTLDLARQAVVAGIKRFIYLSSAKVNGDETVGGHRFSARDIVQPSDPYAVSKNEAEMGLQSLALKSGLEVVIVRPPLVYGAHVGGNFRSLISAVHRGILLPLAGVNNKRSLVSVENLVDLLICIVGHPGAANKILMVSDGDDISTPDLLRKVGTLLGKPARLFSAPAILVHGAAVLTGYSTSLNRLVNSLQVDINETQALLNWKPILTVDQGLINTVKGYLDEKSA